MPATPIVSRKLLRLGVGGVLFIHDRPFKLGGLGQYRHDRPFALEGEPLAFSHDRPFNLGVGLGYTHDRPFALEGPLYFRHDRPFSILTTDGDVTSGSTPPPVEAIVAVVLTAPTDGTPLLHVSSTTGVHIGMTARLGSSYGIVTAIDAGAGTVTLDRPVDSPIVIEWPIGDLPPVPDGLASGALTLQQAIDAATAGTQIGVPDRTFPEDIGVNKTIGIVGVGTGAVIEGSGVRRHWMTVAGGVQNVLVRRMTMQNAAAGGFQEGSFIANGAIGLTLDSVHLISGAWADFSMQGGDGLTLRNCEFEQGRGIGATIGLVNNGHIYGGRFHHNNPTLIGDPGNEAGGIKIGNNASGWLVDGTPEFDHNRGDGLWFDVLVHQVHVVSMRAHHNDRSGLHYEVSDTGLIEGYVGWENGWAITDWQGNDILISSAAQVTVRNSLSAWSRQGIVVYGQGRPRPGGGVFGVTNVRLEGPTVVLNNTRDPNTALIWWGQDFAGPMFSDSNSGAGGRFWSNRADDDYGLFQWNNVGHYPIADWNLTPVGGGNSIYLSTPQRDAILVAAGVPTTPEAH